MRDEGMEGGGGRVEKWRVRDEEVEKWRVGEWRSGGWESGEVEDGRWGSGAWEMGEWRVGARVGECYGEWFHSQSSSKLSLGM